MSGQSPASRRRQPGCVLCRERHLKCDRQWPTCSNCQKAKHATTCRYEPRQADPFRRSRYLAQSTPTRSPSLTARESSPGRATVTDGLPQVSHHGELAENTSTWPRALTQVSPSGSERPIPGTHRDQTGRESPGQLVSPGRLWAEHDVGAMHQGSASDTRDLTVLAGQPLSRARQQEARHSLPLSPVWGHAASSVLVNELECEVFGFFVSHVAYWVSAYPRQSQWQPGPILNCYA